VLVVVGVGVGVGVGLGVGVTVIGVVLLLAASPPHPAKLQRIALNASNLTALAVRCADTMATTFKENWMMRRESR
jgi:hypothetical protein